MVRKHVDAGEPPAYLLELRACYLVVACQLVDHPLPCRVVVHGVGGGVEMAGEGFLGVEWEVGSVEPEAS